MTERSYDSTPKTPNPGAIGGDTPAAAEFSEITGPIGSEMLRMETGLP